MGFIIRGLIWDIPILIFAYVLFWGPTKGCLKVPIVPLEGSVGFRGLGFGVWGLGFRVYGLGRVPLKGSRGLGGFGGSL